MPRQKRVDQAGGCYQAINRENTCQEIFHKPEDYEAFVCVLAQGLEKYPVEQFSFALMPNHWYPIQRPQKDGQMGLLLRWVTASQSLRYYSHYHTRREEHRYQSRFKSFSVQDDTHFYVLGRYVERNPLRANERKRAFSGSHLRQSRASIW